MRFFFVLLLVVQSWALLLEEKVKVGGFVELNGEATIWLRCGASHLCDHNIRAEVLAKIVRYKAPRMTLEFEDGTQAWLKATSAGFEGMYPTSHLAFPRVEDSVLVAQQTYDDSIKAAQQDELASKIARCQRLVGLKFEGVGFGCSQEVLKVVLEQKGIRVSEVGERRMTLVAYKIKEYVMNVHLVFNTNDRFSGIEYHFPLEDQRKFNKNVVPQLKWMGKLFSDFLGKPSEIGPLKTRGLYEDQSKAYLTWEKEGFDIKVLFGKTDGMISASGHIKDVKLYLERRGVDLLNLDAKTALLVEDNFEDLDTSKDSLQKLEGHSKSTHPNSPPSSKASVVVPEGDDEDW